MTDAIRDRVATVWPWRTVALIYVPILVWSVVCAVIVSQYHHQFLICLLAFMGSSGLGVVYGVGAYDLWLRINHE